MAAKYSSSHRWQLLPIFRQYPANFLQLRAKACSPYLELVSACDGCNLLATNNGESGVMHAKCKLCDADHLPTIHRWNLYQRPWHWHQILLRERMWRLLLPYWRAAWSQWDRTFYLADCTTEPSFSGGLHAFMQLCQSQLPNEPGWVIDLQLSGLSVGHQHEHMHPLESR